MPMPDWFDPSMLGGGAGMMPPPAMPAGLLAQGGLPSGAPLAPGGAPAPPPPIPAAPSLPGITPQAAAQAGAPLTPQQQQAALAQAAQAFSQIRPPMPAGGMSPAPPLGSAGLPPGVGMLGMWPMPGGNPLMMMGQNAMAGAGQNPNLMQMLQMRLGASQPPPMGGPYGGGMGIY